MTTTVNASNGIQETGTERPKNIQPLKEKIKRAASIVAILNSDEAIRGDTGTARRQISGIIPLGENETMNREQIRLSVHEGLKAVLRLVEDGTLTFDNPDLIRAWEASLRTNMDSINHMSVLRLRDIFRTIEERLAASL